MRKICLLLCILAGLLSTACATAPYTGRSQLMTVSREKELALGMSASQEILNAEKVEAGTASAKIVENVGLRIAAAAERPDYDWSFKVIQKDELNAFCLPGGKVFVYTRLLQLIGNNQDELAAVMGHEVAHALARHSAERISQTNMASIGQVITGAAVTVATGSSSAGQASQGLYSGVAQLGLLLPYNRLQESEADKIGLILAARAGFNPEAAVTLWEKMAAQEGGKNPPAFLSTHPHSKDRIADIKKALPEVEAKYGKGAAGGK